MPAGARRLLAGSAVDALAEQVGVPDVACVLLDHVDEDVADLDQVVVDGHRLVKGVKVSQPSVGGGTERRASCSASRPVHFISRVRR